MGFFVFLFTIIVIGILAKMDERRESKLPRGVPKPPARYYAQLGGLAPKDKEFYYWERKIRKYEERRKFWKEKEKEWKRKGRGPYAH